VLLQSNSIDVCPGTLKTNVTARVGLGDGNQDSRVILDQNDAEELTSPGQAILVRGVETVKVMSPYLPDDERAQRLADLRQGQIEPTFPEKLGAECGEKHYRTGQKSHRSRCPRATFGPDGV
jgi:DNA segregation ATPase FtsK/SpoIIIE-like protein